MQTPVTFFRLIGAMFYDLMLVFSLVFTMIGVSVLLHLNPKYTFWVITLPTIYGYFIYSWYKGGQTLGMKSWKIYLVGGTFKNVHIRFIAATLSIALGGIGHLFILFDRQKRSLHDKISHTYIVYRPLD